MDVGPWPITDLSNLWCHAWLLLKCVSLCETATHHPKTGMHCLHDPRFGQPIANTLPTSSAILHYPDQRKMPHLCVFFKIYNCVLLWYTAFWLNVVNQKGEQSWQNYALIQMVFSHPVRTKYSFFLRHYLFFIDLEQDPNSIAFPAKVNTPSSCLRETAKDHRPHWPKQLPCHPQ